MVAASAGAAAIGFSHSDVLPGGSRGDDQVAMQVLRRADVDHVDVVAG
jgi:hypothetical protein